MPTKMKTVDERIAILERAASNRRPAELAPLLTVWMRDPSSSVRSKALQLAAEKKVKAAVYAVEKLLNDKSEKVRLTALECLGWLGKGNRRSIRLLLRDSSFLVRIEALETLSVLRDHAALPGIAKLLRDKNGLVRAYAARSIAALHGSAHVKAIENGVQQEKQESARVGFLEALIILGRKNRFDEFLHLLSSKDYRVRCSVANALMDMRLDRSRMKLAIEALSRSKRHALGVADRSCAVLALGNLRKIGFGGNNRGRIARTIHLQP